MRDSRLQHIPLILETPGGKDGKDNDIYAAEITMLYEIQKVEDAEWPEKKVEIEARWRKARDEINPPVEKPAKKGPAKKGKKVEEVETNDE